MTAVIVACQERRGVVHLACDAAFYSKDQRVTSFGTKAHTIPHWPGVIAATGSAAAPPLLAGALSQCFGNFDAFAKAKPEHICDLILACGLQDASADLIVAGLSFERGPEAYTFRIGNELPPGVTREEAEASPLWTNHEGVLIRLPSLVMTPVPNDVVLPANYDGTDLDAEPVDVIWSLRKILEMQRQMKLPDGIGAIGGFGQITTISRAGISQQMLQVWPEDKIGGKLAPSPIDWDRWHKENPHSKNAEPQCKKGWERDVINYRPILAPSTDLIQQQIAMLGLLATANQVVAAKEAELQNAWIQSKFTLGAYKQQVFDLLRLQVEQSRASQAANFGIFNPAQQAEIQRLQITALYNDGTIKSAQDYASAVAVITKNIRDAAEQAAIARSPFEQMTRYALDAANTTKQLDEFGVNALGGLETGIASVVTRTKSLKDAFKDMANSIISDLVRMTVRSTITGPLSGALSGLFSSLGGGGTGSSWVGGIGHNARGTDNWRGGPTWVGEDGPEIIDAPRGSRITPNHALRGGSGAQVVNNFIVENHAKANVQERQERNSSGGIDHRVIIMSTVKQGMAGGELDASQRGRFGNRPPKVL